MPGMVTGTKLAEGLVRSRIGLYRPQHRIVPSLSSAQPNAELAAPIPPEFHVPPAVTARALSMPMTRTTALGDVIVPSPSCPFSFEPQHQTLPSLNVAQLMAVPALI